MMIKRALLLATSLMLMCTVFAATKGEDRSLSVHGDDPKPKTSTGKGKGQQMEHADPQPKTSTGKGKGQQMEHTDPQPKTSTGKGKGQQMEHADPQPKTSTGKGKGQQMEHEDLEETMDDEEMMHLSMSMSMQYQGGKGGKGGKGDKGGKGKNKKHKEKKEPSEKKEKQSKHKKEKSKKDKSDKGSKKGSKKGGDNGKGDDHVDGGDNGKNGGGSPAPPPFALTPTTPSPTSSNSIPIRVSPYSLLYSIQDAAVPSTEDLRQAGEATRVYLESFMVAEFSQTSLTNLDDFLTVVVRNSFSSGNPIQVEFRSTALFNPSSIFLPTVRELDGLITQAFTGENLLSYLSMIQQLPSANQFSGSRNVELTTPIASPRSKVHENSKADPTTAAIGAAAAGIVVLAAGLLFLRGRSNVDDMACDGSLGGKVRSDETCATRSLCASEEKSWRLNSRNPKPRLGSSEDEQDKFDDEYTDKTDTGSLDEDSVSVSGRHSTACFHPSRPNSTGLKL